MISPNQQIFCNVPWYEAHIYWDGSLGICCSESHKLYHSSQSQYNISSMSIKDWFNSEPVKKMRTDILSNRGLSACSSCYNEEHQGANSRRIRANQKSVIFTKTAFKESFQQSPGYQHFSYSANNQGLTTTRPIDLHVDLGNFCNLACKMCEASASSTIASQEVLWGIESSKKFLGSDWTQDAGSWNKFKQELLDIPNLNNIHFMGGETLLTKRMEDFVDTMIEHQRFDLCFSFVTNGTVFKPELIEKLKKFRRVGIEISIETVDEHNSYQRQGTDTNLVLANIQKFLDMCNDSSVTVTLRSVPSVLSIGYYSGLLDHALKHKILIKSILCVKPRFLNAEILPSDIKSHYKKSFENLLNQLDDTITGTDYNVSDPNNYRSVIRDEALMCLNVLNTPTPADSYQQLALMVRHCERWDRVYGYDARKLYPEFSDLLQKHDYDISG